MEFSELGLSPELLRAVAEASYTQPTPIQQKAIPIVLQGRDVLGCAQTGTGKTAGFALPMLDFLAQGRARARMPRALILEPTRELAAQVADSLAAYGKYHKIENALLIGGVSMEEQSRKLDRGADILIATPGRLLDHAERGQVMLGGVKMLVIDETDRMLDMGFIPDVRKIVRLLPPQRQTLFFSATLDEEIRDIGAEFVSNPKEISVAPPASVVATVRQALVRTALRDKRRTLHRLIESEGIASAIVFLNRKRDVDTVVRSLNRYRHGAAPIHGDLAQAARTATLERFRNGDVKFLVASDVAARGLDIPALPFVVNFDVPANPEDYVHRIGRTARAGRQGSAFTLVTEDDAKAVAGIEALIGATIPDHAPQAAQAQAPHAEAPPPSADEAPPTRRPRRSRARRGARAPERGRAAPTAAAAESAQAAAAGPTDAKSRADADGAPRKRKSPKKAPQSKATAPAKPRRREPATKSEPAAPPGAMGGHVPAFLLRPVVIKR